MDIALLGAGLAAVVFTMAVQGPGYDALGIEKDGINESASIPLQQVAAVIQADRPLSEEQQDVLFTILPEKTWKENLRRTKARQPRTRTDSRPRPAQARKFPKTRRHGRRRSPKR